MHSLVRAALTAVLFVTLIAGCGPDGPPPDKDNNQKVAQQFIVGPLVDDKVDGEYDPVDWRKIIAEETNSLYMVFYWDNPKIEAIITIYNEMGVKVGELPHNPKAEKDVIKITVQEGVYYMKITAIEGKSVYTIASNYGAPPSEGMGGSGNTEPRPE